MAKVRVLVVEDSLTVRKRLCEILATDPDLEVVGEAENGKQAIKLCQSLKPDVVTMDLTLPIMSGLAATEYIMAHCPTPILVLSAADNRAGMFKTSEALEAGAFGVLEKNPGNAPDGTWEANLVSTVWLLANGRAAADMRKQAVPPPPK